MSFFGSIRKRLIAGMVLIVGAGLLATLLRSRGAAPRDTANAPLES